MEDLTPAEVKILIKASQISRAKGLKQGANVKEICEKAGISRKTGYQWLNEEDVSTKEKEETLQKLTDLQKDHQKLLEENKHLRFVNEGQCLAMEIHGFDEYLSKKNKVNKVKKRKP